MKPVKEIKAVRVLAKPYLDWKRNRAHKIYLRTPDHFYLKTLKGIHESERCFIIGNGPSLKAEDLDMLRGEYTFAANRIFKIFDRTRWRPTFYLAVDDKVLRETENQLFDLDLGHMFLRYGKTKLNGPTNKLTKIYMKQLDFEINKYNNTAKYISEDVSDHFCDGVTVTYEAIQLAIYMGFKEIYLLGVDHNYSRTCDASGKLVVDETIKDYFDKNQYANTYPFDLYTTQYAYTVAREYCDTHGIRIRNATRGGKLEVFERVDFDSLFTDGEE